MVMNWVYHFNVMTQTGNFHRKVYLMLHHSAGATIHVANLVNYLIIYAIKMATFQERWQQSQYI